MTDRAKKVFEFVTNFEKSLKRTRDFKHYSYTEYEESFVHSINAIYDDLEFFDDNKIEDFAKQMGYNSFSDLVDKVTEMKELADQFIRVNFEIRYQKLWVWYMLEGLNGVSFSLEEIHEEGKNRDTHQDKAKELNEHYDLICEHIKRNGFETLYI